MKNLSPYCRVLLLACAVLTSCTSAKWTVVDEAAVDRSEFTILDEQVFLANTTPVTPQDPVLSFQLLSKNTYRYSQKALIQRAVQDYRLRPGYVALGAAAAAMGFYAANSTAILGTQSTTQRFTLNAVAGLIGLAGILNLKPIGEPRFTGEKRYLRETGTQIETDTLQVVGDSTYSAWVSMRYGDRIILEKEPRTFQSGALDINLGSLLNAQNITGENPQKVYISVSFRDSTLSFNYALDNILQPFARVSSAITILRNAPKQDPENILAELVNGSQLQIVGKQDGWLKVLYGISENFIPREDANIIWRSSEFALENEVIAVPRTPFGNIDVENNIPILTGINPDAFGLIIANESYGDSLSGRNYALRDAQLIDAYLTNALGFQKEHIFQGYDIDSRQQLNEQVNTLSSSTTDSSTVFIYLSGYGSIMKQGEEYELGFIPVGEAGAVGFSSVFGVLAKIPAKKMVVLADIDFENTGTDSSFSGDTFVLNDPLQNIASIITNSGANRAVLFSSLPSQNSEIYTGKGEEDKKHHIFTYYFAKALQQRHTTMAEIVQFLEDNVTFTSRKLYDRAQDPRFYGDIKLDLAGVK